MASDRMERKAAWRRTAGYASAGGARPRSPQSGRRGPAAAESQLRTPCWLLKMASDRTQRVTVRQRADGLRCRVGAQLGRLQSGRRGREAANVVSTSLRFLLNHPPCYQVLSTNKFKGLPCPNSHGPTKKRGVDALVSFHRIYKCRSHFPPSGRLSWIVAFDELAVNGCK